MDATDLLEIGQRGLDLAWTWARQLSITELLQNKFARAVGMLALVWFTIWVIALVYSGYMQDFEKGPVGLRPHVNKRQGEGTIVFDKDVVPYQMDGVEAKCRIAYVYDDAFGKKRKIWLTDAEPLRLHIKPSNIPKAQTLTAYGFETDNGVGDLPSHLVTFPAFEAAIESDERIDPTPPTVAQYVEKHGLVAKWTEDDEAPIVSIGATRLELVEDERATHIKERAAQLAAMSKRGLFNDLRRKQLARDRASVFGSYYVKLQFSKNPWFVLFQHPNRELKMTAWLTVLTSLFSLAMDAWPVDKQPAKASAHQERTNAPADARTVRPPRP